MGSIFVNSVETTTSQISVYWNTMTTGEEIGDSALTTFHLMWDQNSGGLTELDWFNLAGFPFNSLA
jgi:hypothetical protein